MMTGQLLMLMIRLLCINLICLSLQARRVAAQQTPATTTEITTTSTSPATIVYSLDELVPFFAHDHATIKLSPGAYKVSAADVADQRYGRFVSMEDDSETVNDIGYVIFPIDGNNNTFDFTGCRFNVDTAAFRAHGRVSVTEFHIMGNRNTLRNLRLIDRGAIAPIDSALNILLDGQDNLVEGFHVQVKGSFPYGYGDIFGKGTNRIIDHDKHSGCLVRGDRNHVKGCKFTMKSYGHGIFMQGSTDAVIEDCELYGEHRTTDEVLAEEGTGTKADEVDFETVWGFNLRDNINYRFSLHEGGIRAYNSGRTIVNGTVVARRTERITVKRGWIQNMRTGVSIGLAAGQKTVENCTAVGCEVGFWVGQNAVIKESQGDASVGPLLRLRDKSNAQIGVTLLDDAVDKLGDSPSFYISGKGHDIVIHDGTTDTANSTIQQNQDFVIQVGGPLFAIRYLEGSPSPPDVNETHDITIHNGTPYPVDIDPSATGISVIPLPTEESLPQRESPMEFQTEETQPTESLNIEPQPATESPQRKEPQLAGRSPQWKEPQPAAEEARLADVQPSSSNVEGAPMDAAASYASSLHHGRLCSGATAIVLYASLFQFW